MPFGDDCAEPPELPPAADPRTRLRAAVDALGPDELAVLALVAERLAMGRRAYGELRLATDRRDFRREAIEEAADGLVYAACALVRERPAQPAVPAALPFRRLTGAERGR